ncbi:glycine--tRNA ligase subunit beta [Sphingorhabdus sp. 109]|jgi:glycyl-tRNA synthetase beta chain|uniref:glycine--tRNA ligase subunit beta n=1 Tax=Sphingorhabdus sp. 109 TaxID=2653173 RepID=UPI0012EF5537|nr:glycine--tRNA ligase subunit beta [Sphingorhabdus sp. 109]VWX56975.1 Glycine--tRNA ligase beta subunit [Sphingorhabdus sp. 109]
MTDFLLELLSEEIPARMQAKARADLERLFTAQMAEAGLTAGDITVWSTPRRLALIASDLPAQTEAVSEEAKGPPEGAPDQAIDGFCRKNGVTRDQLEVRDVKGRPTYFAVINKPGRDTRDVLAEAIPAIIKAFPWPKSMRWGDASLSTESLRWVRPLSGIVALLGDELVPCEIDGLTSGYDTVGHRFHHAKASFVSSEVERPAAENDPNMSRLGSTGTAPGRITIGNAGDYAEKLRACHVLVDHEERQNIIREGAAKAASDAGLVLVEDEGLVVENAGLTEWPVPLLGAFDPAFLDVPEEVIQLTARVNQKYFVCKYPPNAQHGEADRAQRGGGATPPSAVPAATSPSLRDREEKLAPNFVCTANIDASDGGKAIVAGNEKVLAARLSDAKFFWELDQKTRLEDHAKKLSNIVFHEKLGTVADKVERVAKLAEWLVSLEGNGFYQPSPGDTFHGEVSEAARLCKADLVTEMVGEFPELQGLMGGYYAEKEGKSQAIANAIRDHYKPVGQGDEVPTDPVTVAVSLADKLDTVTKFFEIGELPTGSKDPFALRRAVIAISRLILENEIRLPLWPILAGQIVLRDGSSEYYSIAKQKFWSRSRKEIEDDYQWDQPHNAYPEPLESLPALVGQLMDFFADRLKVQQREAGVRHDLIDAVFALGGEDDLVRLLARVKALQAFVETTDGVNLLAGYKRASNILKKEGAGAPHSMRSSEGEEATSGQGSASSAEHKPLSYTPEKAEKALIDALDAAQPDVTAAIAAEQFEQAMTALAALRGPIDQFFEDVTVNDEDKAKREARLALLARFRNAVHQVADFSQIEG